MLAMLWVLQECCELLVQLGAAALERPMHALTPGTMLHNRCCSVSLGSFSNSAADPKIVLQKGSQMPAVNTCTQRNAISASPASLGLQNKQKMTIRTMAHPH